VQKLGILRSYHTRHGFGPLPTYDPELTLRFDEAHNKNEAGMGAFRVGHFDLVLARYAIEVCGGLDALALTHMDRADEVYVCHRYRQEWPDLLPILRVNPVRTDLGYQEKLTKGLFDLQPEYLRSVDRSMTFAEWYHFCGGFDGIPVMVESYGPSASDKKEVGKVGALRA
jgi:adenylosuccinate synthase